MLGFKRNMFMCKIFCFGVIVCFGYTDASLCRRYTSSMLNDAAVPEGTVWRSNNTSVLEYRCPGASDPVHYSECCSNELTNGCCPQARYFYEIDKTLATSIAVSVTLLCVLFTFVIAICCFWSECPLYSACRVQYSHDIATYVGKCDEIESMPAEPNGTKHKFTAVRVSNGNINLGGNLDVV